MSPLISRLNFTRGFGGIGRKRSRKPTYSVSPSTSAIDEGSSVIFTVTTTNVQSGTTLYYTLDVIGGTIDSSDFSVGSTSGSFTITNNSGSISFTLAEDNSTEGSESFNLQVRNNSISGPILATSSTVIVADTSRGFSATGGTIASPGDGYNYHVFTSPGNFVVNDNSRQVKILVVGGGGAGGYSIPAGPRTAGGGGAGGAIQVIQDLTPGSYPVEVGVGGTYANSLFLTGTPSVFNGANVAYGGGRGGGNQYVPASSQASGGGAGYAQAAGLGNTPPVSPQQGYPGGSSSGPSVSYGSGGGGGAGGAGGNGAPPRNNGAGGPGIPFGEFPAPLIAPAIPEPVRSSWSSFVGSNGTFSAGGPNPVSGLDFTGNGANGNGGKGGDGIVLIKYSILPYDIAMNAYTVNEGESVTFNVKTYGIPDETLYYTVSANSGTVTSSDFINDSGSFSTVGGVANNITITLSNDFAVEGNESFVIQIRTGSTSGPIVVTSAPITITDLFTATGGTITTPGDGYKYHTFTSPGSFAITRGNRSLEYMIVAGGGAGGNGANWSSGGGGAGGFILGSTSISPGTYPITIGAGGANSGDGSPSTFNGNTAFGGGGGGYPGSAGGNGRPGGSGGGSGHTGSGGSGISGQGNPGGINATGQNRGAGGGGAGQVGQNSYQYIAPGPSFIGSVTIAGSGGNGQILPWNGTYYSGGGGGGGTATGGDGSIIGHGGGGAGGGGQGANGDHDGSTAGAINSGGGGGGAADGPTPYGGSNGGSGIVILRYPN